MLARYGKAALWSCLDAEISAWGVSAKGRIDDNSDVLKQALGLFRLSLRRPLPSALNRLREVVGVGLLLVGMGRYFVDVKAHRSIHSFR
jgi:hypothetical protein